MSMLRHTWILRGVGGLEGGMTTFLKYGKYGRCYGFGGWGGGGVMVTFLELANMVDATQEVKRSGVG